MNTNITSTQYKGLNANLVINDIKNSVYYMFFSDCVPHSNNELQPISSDVYDSGRTPRVNMLYGKQISPTNVNPLIQNIPWVTNTIYDMYDDQDVNIATEQFYVITVEGSFNHVWKCLDNNNRSQSIIQPLFADIGQSYSATSDVILNYSNLYQLSDGYRWKYMGSTSSSVVSAIGTPTYFPFVANTIVENQAVYGAIDVIVIENQGKGYNNYLDGVFLGSDLRYNGSSYLYGISSANAVSNTGYYTNCIIYITTSSASANAAGQWTYVNNYISNNSGNFIELLNSFPANNSPGINDTYQIRPQVYVISNDNQQISNCVARALVNTQNSNSIYRTEVLQRGEGYRDSSATVIANIAVGIISNSSINNYSSVRPIMSPLGGHGSSPLNELYSNSIVVSVVLANTENNTLPATNIYQQYGIIRNPLFDNIQCTLTAYTGYFSNNEIVVVVSPVRVKTSVTTTSGNNWLISNSGLWLNQFAANDYVMVFPSDLSDSYISQVASNNASNNYVLILDTPLPFTTTNAIVYIPNISANAVVKSVTNNSLITLTNGPGSLQTGTLLAGLTSGTFATIANISRNGEQKTFKTFVQMYKYIATWNSGVFEQGEMINDTTNAGIAALLHSYTGSSTLTMYLVNFNGGRFNVGDNISGQTSAASATITQVYEQEMIYNTGDILYVENISSITRQPNQEETINVVLNF